MQTLAWAFHLLIASHIPYNAIALSQDVDVHGVHPSAGVDVRRLSGFG